VTRSGAVTSGHPGGHDPRVVEQLQQQIAADDALRLDVADGTESLATWFLGPKAENGDLLRRLVEPASPTLAGTTSAVAAQPGTWFAAGLLELVSALLLVVGAVGVVALARTRGRTLTSVGATLLGIGAIASTGHTIGYYGTYAAYADSGLDIASLTRLNETTDALGGVVIALFMLGMLLGPILLTIGLRRAGAVPVWVSVLAVVFVVSGAVSGVPAGAVGLLAGLASLGYVGVRLMRVPDVALAPRNAPQPSPAI
jgi:hypothetical protein